MKKEVNYTKFIERYLEGVMDHEELSWFKKELEDNKKLQEEIHLHKMINKVIADQKTMSLYEQLNTIYLNKFTIKHKSVLNINLRKIFYATSGIAAAILLFLIISTHQFGLQGSNQKIFNDYYKPAEANMNFRTAGKVSNNALREAMSLYEDKKYEEAIDLFEKILNDDNSRIGINLYSGISNMEIKEYQKANRNFKTIIDQKHNSFIESAEWYLGLCYLITNEEQKAQEIFYKIADDQGYYNKDAKKILKRMR